MGACFSTATKAASAAGDPQGPQQAHKPREAQRSTSQSQQQNRKQGQNYQREKGQEKKASGAIPCGKRTNFGYARDFESKYTTGKLLGHGQFGYTFVATQKATGDRVAVKRIDKSKVNRLKLLPFLSRFQMEEDFASCCVRWTISLFPEIL